MKSMRILGLALMMLMAGSTQAQTVKETADSVKASVKSGNVKDAYSKISGSFIRSLPCMPRRVMCC